MQGRLTAALVLALAAPAVLAGEMPWVKDWDAAKKAAASGKKLIMIDFSTTW